MPIKVLSLNIWNRDGAWPERAKLIQKWLDRLEPDLIGLQEVLRGADVEPLLELLDGRGYHVEYARSGPFWEDESLDFGNAAASRWPITDHEVLALPKGRYTDACSALSITTDSPQGPVSFTTTHLMYTVYAGHVREQQVLALSELVLRRRPKGGFPPIVCGDFNAGPESSEIRFMKGLQSLEGRSFYLLDAWEHAGDGSRGETMTPRNRYCRLPGNLGLRIDYVFVGPALPDTPGRIERCAVVCDEEENGAFPSDHFGVYAELS
ncbi:MAG: endonuclease/exonuclease/phosphatase family protein [Deltaproteobacteria bacterium]|nr:endonuclease/exonuclease/phosphatase family protein [Deltaproteobacteria bacterium]